MSRANHAPGFTLIEVVVALAIVAFGMAAVMSTLSSSARTVSFLRDETFAQWVALNQITQLRLANQPPATGNSDGDTDFANRSWHWHREVTTTDVAGILRIDIKVRPKESAAAGTDNEWTTTVTGLYGGAVGRPNGYFPSWGTQMLPGGAGAGGPSGTLGANGGFEVQPTPPPAAAEPGLNFAPGEGQPDAPSPPTPPPDAQQQQ